MTVDNKMLVRRFVEEMLNNGNIALTEELFDRNFVGHNPPAPDVRGIEEAKHRQAMYRSAFPDLHYAIKDLIAEGDIVAWRWTVQGTHKGPLLGVAPTGKYIVSTGTTACRITNEKFRELWTNWDALGLLYQLGVVPGCP